MTTNNKNGIILLSNIPVRREPAEQSEMVTQLLFGDTFQCDEKQGNWLHICNDYDNYEGWVSENTVTFIDDVTYKQIIENKSATVASLHATLEDDNGNITHILQGGSLPNYDFEKKTVTIGKQLFTFNGEIVTPQENIREKIGEYSKMYENAPYLWGGKTLYGIDCSGFTQVIAKLVGIKLERDASQQIQAGKTVAFTEQGQCGDLAFFDNEEGNITHVGILLDKQTIIHASGRVRIDRIDQQGIYNRELQRYTHKLRTIKNIID